MTIINASCEPIHIVMFPDGRLDTKNAARYLGLKEKTLALLLPDYIICAITLFPTTPVATWLQNRKNNTNQIVNH